MIKKAGQLNALLIEDDRFSYESVDDLPLVRVRCDVVPRNQDPLFITWRESEVRILTRGTQRDECLHLSSGKRLWIDHAFLHERDGHWQADDFTTYQMPLQRGELVSLVSCYDRFALIKKAGSWAGRIVRTCACDPSFYLLRKCAQHSAQFLCRCFLRIPRCDDAHGRMRRIHPFPICDHKTFPQPSEQRIGKDREDLIGL